MSALYTRTAETESHTSCALGHLFANNRDWAAEMIRHDPSFFRRLSNEQTADYFWIGCSDSRVPPSQIVGLPPGGVRQRHHECS